MLLIVAICPYPFNILIKEVIKEYKKKAKGININREVSDIN